MKKRKPPPLPHPIQKSNPPDGTAWLRPSLHIINQSISAVIMRGFAVQLEKLYSRAWSALSTSGKEFQVSSPLYILYWIWRCLGNTEFWKHCRAIPLKFRHANIAKKKKKKNPSREKKQNFTTDMSFTSHLLSLTVTQLFHWVNCIVCLFWSERCFKRKREIRRTGQKS